MNVMLPNVFNANQKIIFLIVLYAVAAYLNALNVQIIQNVLNVKAQIEILQIYPIVNVIKDSGMIILTQIAKTVYLNVANVKMGLNVHSVKD